MLKEEESSWKVGNEFREFTIYEFHIGECSRLRESMLWSHTVCVTQAGLMNFETFVL